MVSYRDEMDDIDANDIRILKLVLFVCDRRFNIGQTDNVFHAYIVIL